MSLPQSFEGKFETLHKISEGGMGAVYKVRHVLLDEVRVIKVVRPQHAGDENLKARFHREARTATRLRHPNIAVMHDFSIDEAGTAYIVMEFIDGQTLRQVLAGGGPPPLAKTLEIARQSLDALAYLHGEGYVHRDISPDNLMLTRGSGGKPLVKLIDLGVAKRVGGGHELTSTGMFLGKVRYSSPEQFSGVDLDARSDVYSFGVMLYELLTGRIPIQGEDFSSFIGGHLYRSPISFDVTDPEGRIPPGLRRVVMKTLEKKAENRVASAGELARMLAPYSRRAATRETVWVDEQESTVLSEGVAAAPLRGDASPAPLRGDVATALPTGLVSEAMQRIDQLLDAGNLEEAERQLTETIAELGEVAYLRGLREKLERARAGHDLAPADGEELAPTRVRANVPMAPAEPMTQVAVAPEARKCDAGAPAARRHETPISATDLTEVTAMGEEWSRPSRLPRWWAVAVVVALAVAVGAIVWVLSQRSGPVDVASAVSSGDAANGRGRRAPIAEATYLMVRDRIEAGDVTGVRRVLREAIEADPAEAAEREWATAGEAGPYLPYFYLGLANAMANDCVAALDAWNESERQGEVQKTAQHPRLLAERAECDALYAKTVELSEKRLGEAAEYAGLLETATTEPEFDHLWRRSPELRREIEDALADHRTLLIGFEQARGAGFGAVLRLETDVVNAAERLGELADRVAALTG